MEHFTKELGFVMFTKTLKEIEKKLYWSKTVCSDLIMNSHLLPKDMLGMFYSNIQHAAGAWKV